MDRNNLDHISSKPSSIAPVNFSRSRVGTVVSAPPGMLRNVCNVASSPAFLARNLTFNRRDCPYSGLSGDSAMSSAMALRSMRNQAKYQCRMNAGNAAQASTSTALMAATTAVDTMLFRPAHHEVPESAACLLNAEDLYHETSTALARAVLNGDTVTVECLLESASGDVNACNAKGISALSGAAFYGQGEIVRMLLRQSDINVHAGRPLLYAIHGNQRELVRQLLDFPGLDVNRDGALAYVAMLGNADILNLLLQVPDIDVNGAVWYGDPVLICAAKRGHVEVVRLLLRDGRVNLNAINASGYSALSHAVNEERAQIIAHLLQSPDIDPNQGAPVFRAAMKGNWGLVDMLLCDLRINVNAEFNLLNGSDGCDTLLSMAAAGGELRMVRRLLAHSAIDPNGGNPLLKAASQGHWEVLQALLVGDRINVNVANSSGESALMLAVAQGRIDIVKCLLDVESIDINHEDCRGNTALIIAACAGNADIVSSLLAHSRIDPNRGMPMLRAAQHHHWHVAEQFFQVPHINFNSVDDDNLTILCHAVKSGRLRETTSLLGHAEIDVHQGGPLIHAVMYGRVNMTRVLLDAPGFAVARAAAQKDVALSIAISNGRSAIEKMLREHGANTIWRRR